MNILLQILLVVSLGFLVYLIIDIVRFIYRKKKEDELDDLIASVMDDDDFFEEVKECCKPELDSAAISFCKVKTTLLEEKLDFLYNHLGLEFKPEKIEMVVTPPQVVKVSKGK